MSHFYIVLSVLISVLYCNSNKCKEEIEHFHLSRESNANPSSIRGEGGRPIRPLIPRRG